MLTICARLMATLVLGVAALACERPSNAEPPNAEKYLDDRLNTLDQLPRDPIVITAADKPFTIDCSKPSWAIVRGSWVGSEHSLVPSLVKITSASGICSGTVIGPRHILTAAHCLPEGTEPRSLRIGTGVSGAWDGRISIMGFHVHPSYRGLESLEQVSASTGLFDLALLVAAEALPSTLTPVSIAQPSDLAPSGEGFVAGYGAYGEGDFLPRPLTATRTKLSELIPERRELQIEGADQSGPCYGDSGGPLFIKTELPTPSCFLLAGSITGRARGEQKGCVSGRATVMDLTLFRDWIACSMSADGQVPAQDSSKSACLPPF